MPEQPVGAPPAIARAGQGSGTLLLSSALFCFSDAFIKYLTQFMPLGAFMLVRAGFGLAIFLAVMPRVERRGVLRHAGHRFVLARALCEALSVACYVLALQELPLATVTSIYMGGPILTIGFAVLMGMTRLNVRLAAGAGLAFTGVLLVALPREGGQLGAILLAFGAALFVAARDLVTRAMPPGTPSSTVALATMMCVGLVGALAGPVAGDWTMPAPWLIALVALAAAFTASGNYLVILAFRAGDPGLMSVLRYSAIPIAMLTGLAVFGHVPGPLALLGGALVIAGGSLALAGSRIRP